MMVHFERTVAILVWVSTESRGMRVVHIPLDEREDAASEIGNRIDAYRGWPDQVIYVDQVTGDLIDHSSFAILVEMLT